MFFLKKLAKKFPRQNSIFNNDQLLSYQIIDNQLIINDLITYHLVG